MNPMLLFILVVLFVTMCVPKAEESTDCTAVSDDLMLTSTAMEYMRRSTDMSPEFIIGVCNRMSLPNCPKGDIPRMDLPDFTEVFNPENFSRSGKDGVCYARFSLRLSTGSYLTHRMSYKSGSKIITHAVSPQEESFIAVVSLTRHQAIQTSNLLISGKKVDLSKLRKDLYEYESIIGFSYWSLISGDSYEL